MAKGFKIEDNIPMPVARIRGQQQPLIDALAALDVGQSFFVPVDACKTPSTYCGKVAKASGAKFTCRKSEEKGKAGHRIWRFA
jgi:hypothetical protein